MPTSHTSAQAIQRGATEMRTSSTIIRSESAAGEFLRWNPRARALFRLLISSAALCAAASGGPVEFNRDIRPILSDRCFTCHGPDAANRQAGLRFDLEGGAKAVSDKILRRIASPDPAVRMPPVYSGRVKL